MNMNLGQIFRRKKSGLDKDNIAALLSTNREALEAFEKSYQINALSNEEDD